MAAETGGPDTGRFSIENDPGSVTRDDATCAIAWRADGYEAIEVYVDPALGDRDADICETVEALAGAHRDIDTLTDAIETYAAGEELSASIYERPDAAPLGLVAIAFTIG
ncbi:MAG TPA: hypothetical protein VFS32_02010 [Candidatus Limnocylindrales bacterium]|nr:hypothetical protein [Candidatus Limnocylindrales bacterium]